MNKSKVLFSVLFLCVVFGIAAVLFTQSNNRLVDSTNAAYKQLDTIEVLETANFNGDVPQFKLNIQAKEDFMSTPERLVVMDKSSQQEMFNLPLFQSVYTGECLLHTETLSSIKKWETDWFSIPNFSVTDNLYSSKLSDTYSVKVVYSDESSELFQSTNSISGVCYQVSKTESSSPNPEDEVEEYE